MNTARFRCNACGEPLVRPVLSCPYCGAFRSAVPLDSADQLEDERDTYVDEPAHDPAAEEVVEYGAEDGVEPDDEHAAGADDEPTDIVYVEDQDTTEERDRDVPLAVPVDDPAATPSPASSGDLSGVRGRRVDAPLEAAPRPARAERSGPEPAGRRIEPTIGGPAPEPAARRVGAPEVRLPGGSRGEADAVDPLSPESRTGEEAPAAPSPEADGETRRGRRRRPRASAQRRVAPNPPVPGPTSDHRPAVEPPHDDEAYEDEADDESASTHSSIDAFLLETEDRPRERRRRGWGGLIALLVILLLLVGGGGAAYYWLESRGVIDALRGSETMRVTRLGEPQSVSIPTSWTSVPDPASGGAVGVLIDGDGPFRLRVDGTVYTLDDGEPVRVPVRTGTALEVRGLGGPVTLEVTRLGEEVAPE